MFRTKVAIRNSQKDVDQFSDLLQSFTLHLRKTSLHWSRNNVSGTRFHQQAVNATETDMASFIKHKNFDRVQHQSFNLCFPASRCRISSDNISSYYLVLFQI